MRGISKYHKNYEKDDSMRVFLQPLEGQTLTFDAIFEKFGRTSDGRKTMLVSSVKNSGELLMAGHVHIRQLCVSAQTRQVI